MPIWFKKWSLENFTTTILFGALFLIPVLVSVNHYSYYVNNTAAIIMALISIALSITFFPNAQIANRKITLKQLMGPIAFIIIAGGWTYQYIPFYGIDRSLIYLSALIFYLSLHRKFQQSPELANIFLHHKLLTVTATCIFFILFVLFFANAEDVPQLKPSPPLYRHLRHLNYEIFFGAVIALLHLPSKNRHHESLAILFICALLTIWSGARGAAIAITISFIIILLRTPRKEAIKTTFILTGFVLISLLLVLSSDYDAILKDTLGITAGDTINRISSGRLGIWSESVDTLIKQGPVAILTGLGPDAFSRWGLFKSIVQPHNALVQVVMEFGLIGLAIFCFAIGRVSKQALYLIRHSKDNLQIALSAAFIGGLAYSLVDGIFYHAYPLAMMIFLAAAIHSSATSMQAQALP